MKKIITVIALTLIGITNASADEQGGWVKIDANGNTIGGVIVCTPDVCGDKNSTYSQLTLKEGESYVLQTNKMPSGNVVGVTSDNYQKVSVDVKTNDWTVVSNTNVTVNNLPVSQKTSATQNKTSVTKFNPYKQGETYFDVFPTLTEDNVWINSEGEALTQDEVDALFNEILIALGDWYFWTFDLFTNFDFQYNVL